MERETMPADRPTARLRRRRQRGVAMLMVLAAVALLYVLGEQTREEVEVYSLSATVARDQLIAEYQARSAINLTRVILHAEPTIRRAITPVLGPIMMLASVMGGGAPGAIPQIPVWEQADLLLGAFRNNAGGAALGELAGVDLTQARGLGALTGVEPVVIVDEDAKINVNGVNRSSVQSLFVARQLASLLTNPQLDPYFEERDADDTRTDRLTLVGAVIDYIDLDTNGFDVTQLPGNASAAGASAIEDSFYERLRRPYHRRNAPLDSIEELRMVRGLGDDALWRAVVDPDPGDPRRRTLTVWGQGSVNVNTANAQTILAVVCAYAPNDPQCIDPMAIQRFITGITLLRSFTAGIPFFSSPSAFVRMIQQGAAPGAPGQNRPAAAPRSPFGGLPGMGGGGLLGMLGIQPFQIGDAAALSRSLAVESKVFSVYSEARVGHAHVRLHAVIDMRPQPPLPSQFLRASGVQLTEIRPGELGAVSARGGTIIYWRED